MTALLQTSLVRFLFCTALLSIVLPNAGCRPPKSELASQPEESREKNSGNNENEAKEPERTVPAVHGVGKRGQSLRDNNDYLSTVGTAFFDAKQRVIFDIKIPHAMNLFKAEHGHFPKSEEEFFERIVKANLIELPELPEGHSYFYDTEAGTLMVRQPAGEDGGE